MSDLIERQAAIKALRKGKPKETEYRGSCADSCGIGKLIQYESDISAVIALPSAEPERKKGEWIPAFDGKFTGGAYWFSCSKCKRIVPEVRNGGWNYCPNCGALMKGEEDETD